MQVVHKIKNKRYLKGIAFKQETMKCHVEDLYGFLLCTKVSFNLKK